MERIGSNTTAASSFGHLPGWLWLPALVGLVAWQAWLTLGLFGPDPIAGILSDEPILSGLHPQHLYLGTIGAQALAAHGNSCAYDHAFQIGFPITPIFDGSRLASVFLLFGGGAYQPAAYKFGLAACCMLVPLLLLTAALGAGFERLTTLVAVFLGQLVWWGPLGRNALESGNSEIYLAALAGLANVGLLLAFHRTSSLVAWTGLLLTGCLGWFLQPLLFPIALPLLLTYYLCVGARHDFLTWHLAFWLAQAGAVIVNLPWLVDWASYWWLRAPLPSATSLLQQRTIGAVWTSAVWGGSADRALAIGLLLSATIGTAILNQTQQRPAARLLGIGAGGALTLAMLGISWEPLGLVGSAAMLAPALWFGCLPAAHAWIWVARALGQHGVIGRAAGLALLALPLVALCIERDTSDTLLGRCVQTRPLLLGVGPRRQQFLLDLVAQTRPDARILWEDRPLPGDASRWPALLPLLTGRQFLGGLDPDGFLEHSSICLSNQCLEGRPIATWSDEELTEYCRLYNIGWIVAWTPRVTERFETWDGADRQTTLHDDTDAVLFRVKRTGFTYALKGQADLLQADPRHIIFADVAPDDGVVVLSLHYQAGMRASPGRVLVEREPSGDDPIGFVRLRLAAPAARVTLTWDR